MQAKSIDPAPIIRKAMRLGIVDVQNFQTKIINGGGITLQAGIDIHLTPNQYRRLYEHAGRQTE